MVLVQCQRLNLCSSRDSINVTFNPIPVVGLGQNFSLCIGDQQLLDATAPNAAYLWQDNSTSATFNVDGPGTYDVQVTIDGCTSYDTIVVDSYAPIQIAIDPISDFCEGKEVQFVHNIPTSQGLISNSTWDFGDASQSNDYFPLHTYSSSGTFTVTLNVTSIYGCTAQTAINVSVIAKPNADFSYSPENPLKEKEIDFTNLSTDSELWVWTFGDGSGRDEQNPVHTYEVPFLYKVVLISYNQSCSDTAIKSILVLDELVYYVPNAFTPDISGFNESFKPVFTSGFNPYQYHLTIFDRYGEILFESYDPDIGWDGTYSGRTIVPLGTYVWRIEFGVENSDEKNVVNGQVTILR